MRVGSALSVFLGGLVVFFSGLVSMLVNMRRKVPTNIKAEKTGKYNKTPSREKNRLTYGLKAN